MPNFQVVVRAALSPTRCAFCNGAQGPFVDTLVTHQPHYGRIYICLGSCVAGIARACGLVWPESVEHLEDEVERLTAELAEAKARRVVPMSEVMAELDHAGVH